ncbi:hypothetical protein [Streptomyces thermolineatus]
MACPGYQTALAAHRAVAPERWSDPAIAEAVERQTRAMRELSLQAFPEPDAVLDDAPASFEQARARRRQEAAASGVAALPRARAERAARQAGTQAVVPQQPAALRTTA